MIAFTMFNSVILLNYWIFSLSHFHPVSGAKPNCKGDPLRSEDFSKKGDVGFVRDICVDIIARNLYNTIGGSISNLCEDLANMRASTFFGICTKWIRSHVWNKGAKKQVLIKAEALMEHFNEEVSKVVSLNDVDEKFIFDCMNEAKRRLMTSKTDTKDSKILGQLEDMKKYFCTRYHLDELQKVYQVRIGKNDPITMQKIHVLFKNEDFLPAIKQFIRNFEVENKAKILNYHIESNVVKCELMLSGINRLRFEYVTGQKTKASAAILKLPSLAPEYHKKWKKTNIYDREVYFYKILLPALYQMGKCTPFTPKLYAATQGTALVLEDLSVDGYKHTDYSELYDLDHTRLCLDVLALYHARGYKYLQNLSIDDPNMSLIRSVQPTIWAAPVKNDFGKLCELVKPTLDESLYQKILDAENEILYDSTTKIHPDENNMNVIIHGDFHARNILFKCNDENKVCQAKIIDWQYGRKGSPVLDLIDFFVGNVETKVFEFNYDDLLDSYLITLNRNLNTLSANRKYDRSELDRDMVFYKYYHFRILSDLAEDFIDFELSERESWVSHLSKWLKYLERKGLI